MIGAGICSAISWEDVEWMSTQTELPLVLKGLGRAEDALRAADCPGVKAVICSNHGGRNLDGGPASADVLLQVMRPSAPFSHTKTVICQDRLGTSMVLYKEHWTEERLLLAAGD
jgi:hypothetical protein